MPDFTELKQKHRATWASGDYNQIAQGIQAVADHVVRSGRIRAGERVLDIACGTGNTALMARARSAAVTGLDLTPELLAIAQKRAAEEGYGDITWKAGDAEDLPFPDGTFDVVVSSCGLMFAPDQQKVANEVARVTKRGGRIAIQAWTRESGVGRMFKVTGAYVPPPVGVPSPFEWGDEGKVRRCSVLRFGTTGSNGTTARNTRTPPNSLPTCSSINTGLLTAPTMHSRPRRRLHSAKT